MPAGRLRLASRSNGAQDVVRPAAAPARVLSNDTLNRTILGPSEAPYKDSLLTFNVYISFYILILEPTVIIMISAKSATSAHSRSYSGQCISA